MTILGILFLLIAVAGALLTVDAFGVVIFKVTDLLNNWDIDSKLSAIPLDAKFIYAIVTAIALVLAIIFFVVAGKKKTVKVVKKDNPVASVPYVGKYLAPVYDKATGLYNTAAEKVTGAYKTASGKVVDVYGNATAKVKSTYNKGKNTAVTFYKNNEDTIKKVAIVSAITIPTLAILVAAAKRKSKKNKKNKNKKK